MTACIGVPKKAYKQHPTMRLRNPITGKWLHLSGTGETGKESDAWAGLARQARTLRDRAETWPYQRENIEQPETPSW